jgi:hypothetical protein
MTHLNLCFKKKIITIYIESVLGHHPVTAALVAPHKWARVVNKNAERQI